MEIDKELLKGHIDTILLSLLQKTTMYGFELTKKVREQSDGNFELKEATMYLALKRLEKGGYIESFWGNEESGGGRRKYYRVLPPGIDRYIKKQQEWQFMKKVLDTFYRGETQNEAD